MPKWLKVDRLTPSIRNHPVNYKMLSKAEHDLLHKKATPLQTKVRLATPEWAPPVMAGLLGHIAVGVDSTLHRRP